MTGNAGKQATGAPMQLVAVSTGKTREVDIQGSKVHTAYLKSVAAGPCFIDHGGPVGNETAVHPDTVYGIAEEHYGYWASRLAAGTARWGFGYFAENLTIRGLSEQALRIGDVLQVGESLRLIVTGPRIPCFKVAWRMGQPESFVRDFAASGRTGVYFAVAQPGMIASGDAVRVVHSQENNPTVFDVGAIARGEIDISAQELERLLAIPCLSQTAALLLGGLLYRRLDRPDPESLWDGWRQFVITQISAETPDIKSYRLEPADGGAVPRHVAGQFVPVRFRSASGQEFVRPWSLSSYAREPGDLRITVKREPRGGASDALHNGAHTGSVLELRPPSGSFRLDRSRVMPVVLVGAGIGVTPLMAMMHAHLDRGTQAPPLRFIHCVRDGTSHPLRDEITALERRHPGLLRAHFFYSRPTDEDRRADCFQSEGRLTGDRLIAALDDLSIEFAGKTIPVPWYEADLYLCGPESFLQQMTRYLLARGARSERLYTERFDPNAGAAEVGFCGERAISEARVQFRRSAKEVRWRAGEDLTLLDLAQTAGLELPFSCRSGYCQTCQCRIVEGEARYEYAPLCAPSPGHALLCCARPASALLVLDA